jgi:hypothetical protein
LLKTSPAAKVLLDRLQADQARLRQLPLAKAPVDLTRRIMAALPTTVSVGDKTPAPVRSRPIPPVVTPAPQPVLFARRRPRTWLPIAVAASLLLAVMGGSVVYFAKQNHSGPQPGSGDLARAESPVQPAPQPNLTDVLPPDDAPLPSRPPLVAPQEVAIVVSEVPTQPKIEVVAPPRLVFEGNAFPPVPPIPPLKVVDARVPFLASVVDFERDDIRSRFTEELGRDAAFRVDLFARDPSRGAELFQGASRSVGLTVQVDPQSQERIKRKQGTAYMVYAECLTAAEWRDLFIRLGADDGKAPQRVFDCIHVATAVPSDQRDLRELLGIDPGLWKHPQPPATHAQGAETKPISAGTGDQIARSLSTSPGVMPNKAAVLVTFAPPGFRGMPPAREVRDFMANRPTRKANVVPMMVVIRPQPN